MTTIFIHGVPDTPAVWKPLIQALGLEEGDYLAPALPGFKSKVPVGFTSTKEAYVNWLLAVIEKEFLRSGPIDLVGHDWGALLSIRAAVLRPDLIRSWVAINAVPVSGYKWHITARRWQTPVLGELLMLFATRSVMKSRLQNAGVPEALATEESLHWGWAMKRAILKLYRSAKSLDYWAVDLAELPRKGLVIWGKHDPFITVDYAKQFCEEQGFPLRIVKTAGHWTICQRPARVAARLKNH